MIIITKKDECRYFSDYIEIRTTYKLFGFLPILYIYETRMY